MVAYSFHKRFADDVEALIKRQTIRGQRKRHARIGENVQLYHGMRTRQCRKLVTPDPICIAVEALRLKVPTKLEPCVIFQRGEFGNVTDAFAKDDGFAGVEDFTRFWFDTHGPGDFYGVLIKWKPANG
ncbi:MAG: ASCH domain-containing protein [Pseudomonadota bacterium]